MEIALGLSSPHKHSRNEQTSIMGKWVSLLWAAFRSNRDGACHISTGKRSMLLLATFRCFNAFKWNRQLGNSVSWLFSMSSSSSTWHDQDEVLLDFLKLDELRIAYSLIIFPTYNIIYLNRSDFGPRSSNSAFLDNGSVLIELLLNFKTRRLSIWKMQNGTQSMAFEDRSILLMA